MNQLVGQRAGQPFPVGQIHSPWQQDSGPQQTAGKRSSNRIADQQPHWATQTLPVNELLAKGVLEGNRPPNLPMSQPGPQQQASQRQPGARRPNRLEKPGQSWACRRSACGNQLLWRTTALDGDDQIAGQKQPHSRGRPQPGRRPFGRAPLPAPSQQRQQNQGPAPQGGFPKPRHIHHASSPPSLSSIIRRRRSN